jgi:hypothetical protein
MKTPVKIEFEYSVLKPKTLLHVMFHLFNERGILVLTSGAQSMKHEVGKYISSCEITGGLLNEGTYSLRLQVVENNSDIVYARDNIASFEVIDIEPRTEGWMGREPGVVQPAFPWRTQMAGPK